MRISDWSSDVCSSDLVALRERVAFSDDAIAPALAALRALPQVREVALLSTCNRTELYAVADDDGQALADWLAPHPGAAGAPGTGPGQAPHPYHYHQRDGGAVRHSFLVATGPDPPVPADAPTHAAVHHHRAQTPGAATASA